MNEDPKQVFRKLVCENWRSINQIAQEDGGTSGNEAERIRKREAAVSKAWRVFSYEKDRNPSAEELSLEASTIAEEPLGVEYVRFVAGTRGYPLAESSGKGEQHVALVKFSKANLKLEGDGWYYHHQGKKYFVDNEDRIDPREMEGEEGGFFVDLYSFNGTLYGDIRTKDEYTDRYGE